MKETEPAIDGMWDCESEYGSLGSSPLPELSESEKEEFLALLNTKAPIFSYQDIASAFGVGIVGAAIAGSIMQHNGASLDHIIISTIIGFGASTGAFTGHVLAQMPKRREEYKRILSSGQEYEPSQ